MCLLQLIQERHQPVNQPATSLHHLETNSAGNDCTVCKGGDDAVACSACCASLNGYRVALASLGRWGTVGREKDQVGRTRCRNTRESAARASGPDGWRAGCAGSGSEPACGTSQFLADVSPAACRGLMRARVRPLSALEDIEQSEERFALIALMAFEGLFDERLFRRLELRSLQQLSDDRG